MLLFRRNTDEQRCYTLDEAVDFLGFDRRAVEYWLQMRHIDGRWDEDAREWRIRPRALVDFLHEAGEPMPTGASTLAPAGRRAAGASAA